MHGAITGQVAIGRFVLHIGGSHGALVGQAPPAWRIDARPRATPILLRPRSIRGLFGRITELNAIFTALEEGLPVEISGEPGIGKTAVLRSAAYHPAAASFIDGILYLAARDQSSADLQQQIFDAFYESDEISKPTTAEIRRALQGKRALILIDDVRLNRQDLEQLIDVAPRSSFIVATRERRLCSEVLSVVLNGLAVDDGVMLLEREIARPLEDGERPAAENLCAALQGHPLRILQAAAFVRDRGLSLDQWATDIAPEDVVTESLASVDQKQRRILLVLAALPSVPMQAQHVSGIAEIPDIEPSLAALVQRALVLSTQAGHRLADGVADRLRRTEDLNPWVNRAVTYYTAWAERYRRDPDALLDESEALRRVQLHATNVRRWGEALRVGQILEGALVAGVRWDAWAMVLEHCLLAAKATGDRTAEAWALHEIGTRAICVGETRGARSALSEALKLRETLGDADAIDASRRNLNFVLAPAFDPPPEPKSGIAERFESDSLQLQDEVEPRVGIPTRRKHGAMTAVACMLAVLGGLAYWWSAGLPKWPWDVSTEPPARAWTEARVQETPVANAIARPVTQSVTSAERPNILIFSPRPGSLGPTKLCYAVAGAVRAVVEPGIGDVNPTDRLTCLRVAPARTTTYQLTALGRDGDQVRQQLVVIVR
jgi:hypothetical protein